MQPRASSSARAAVDVGERPPAALETSEAAGRALLELVDVDARSARYAALELRALRLGLY